MLDQIKSLNPDGSPPRTRIAKAEDAYQIWNQLRMADAVSSFERARWQAMYDNTPPLDQSKLDNNGQSYRVNVSWGLAPMVLDMAQSGYVDILNSTEVFFECPTMLDIPDEQRKEVEDIIAEEVTNAIRSWRDFNATYLRLTSTFIKEAVSFATFDDEWDWRFDSKGLSDFKISRKTKVGQDNIDVACWLRFYSMSQLYQFIKDPELAESQGWNVEAVKKAILQSVNNSNTFNRYMPWDWEKLEIELRNNDYYWTYGIAQTQNIRIVHMIWQEFDGRYSYGILCDDEQQKEWLYHKVGRYASSYNAFTAYTYGVGNDYYHGIRGQGYIIYPIVGALNRAYSQLLEVSMFGSAPMLQPQDESAMQAMQYIPAGAYNLITPGINVLPNSTVPNLSQGVLPTISAFTQMFREQTANANTQSLIESPKEMTAAEVNARLGSIAKMSSSSLSLFYDPWESTLREMVRRMKRRDYSEQEPGGKAIVELKAKILRRGGAQGKLFLEAFYELDTSRLRAKRAIGSGSEAARMLAFNQLMQILPYLPEGGRTNVIRDFVAGYVSYRNANRYTSESASPVTNAQESIAWTQNSLLKANQFQPVLPNDDHFVHARVHTEELVPLTKQVGQMIAQLSEMDSQGQPVDLQGAIAALEGLQTLNAHDAEHVAKLSINPMGQQLASQYKQALQQTDEVINNGGQHLQKLYQKQAQQAAQQSQQPQADPSELAELEMRREKTRAEIDSIHARTQADVAKTQAEIAKMGQEGAIKDATAAQDIRLKYKKAAQEVQK